MEDAIQVLSEAPAQLSLPFASGLQLQFYAQAVLVVLVALERADLRAEGRRFFYDIHF